MLHDWGRISATFLRNHWVCLSFLTKAAGIPDFVEDFGCPETLKAALSCSVEALALLPSDLVLPVLTFMRTVLPQVSPLSLNRSYFRYFQSAVSALALQLLFHDEMLCVEAVTLSWRLVQGLSTNAHDFWPALKGFISTAFHHKVLQLTDSQAPMLVTTLRQVIKNYPVEYLWDTLTKAGCFCFSDYQ